MAPPGTGTDDKHPAPRLYVVTAAVDDTAAATPALRAVLGAADIAAVLLRLAPADERSLINRIKTLAPIIQGAGAALVLDGHAELAARAGADGAHIHGIDPFLQALSALKPERIAGAGGLASRHDAMLAAEGGADYVMFGEPEPDGYRPAFAAVLERVGWWAEVFEAPCVAYAAGLDEVAPLVAAGADFVALGDWVWADPDGAAVVVAAAARRLAAKEPVG
jgi:thiamine-phosphate pyrophosphorylase